MSQIGAGFVKIRCKDAMGFPLGKVRPTRNQAGCDSLAITMKAHTQFLLISIGCNIILAGHTWFGRRPADAANHPPLLAENSVMERSATAAPDKGSLECAKVFDWNQVESDDYRAYIANLRAIKCPEETIRDLIFADVRKLFAARQRELLQSEAVTKYQREGALANLKLQEDATLDMLLGAGWREDGSAMLVDPVTEARLAFLEPGQAARVRQLEERYEMLVQSRIAQTAGFITLEDQKEIDQLEKDRYQEMAKVLNEKDYVQYLCANHPIARQMDSEGFAYRDSQEFLAVLAEREKLRGSDNPDATMSVQAEHETQMRTLLGDDRYQAYRRFQSPEFRELDQLTHRFGLAEGVSAQVQDLRERLARESGEFQARGLDESALTAGGATLARQTEDQIRGLLGDSAFRAWQNAGFPLIAAN